MNGTQKVLTLVLMLLAVGLWGCTKCNPSNVVTCDMASKYSDMIAGQVAPVLGCTGVAAMSADITAELQRDNLCSKATANPTGAVAGVVCPYVVQFLVHKATAQIPPAWACTGGSAASWSDAALTAECVKIPY